MDLTVCCWVMELNQPSGKKRAGDCCSRGRVSTLATFDIMVVVTVRPSRWRASVKGVRSIFKDTRRDPSFVGTAGCRERTARP